MPDWRQEIHDFATAAERRLWQHVNRAERLFDRDTYVAAGYRGYGTREKALVLGRVLQADEINPDVAAGSRWRNLAAALTRIESDPLPGARVRVAIGGASDDAREVVADDEGFFREWIGSREPLPEGAWLPVRLSIDARGGAVPTRGGAVARGGAASMGGGAASMGGGAALQGPRTETVSHVLIPPPGAAFGVISDMDDTVLQSNVASFLRAARLVLLENAHTRMPFPGVAAFYRALEKGTGLTGPNPIFYVSKSPWNLYDVIVQFLERQGIPLGPVLLRDWDLVPARATKGFKAIEIEQILQTYPTLPFILIGDSTQKDPEIYREVVRAFPGRVLAVYIRNVRASAARSEAVKKLAEELRAEQATLILADDTRAMAAHAAEQGWIDKHALGEIGGDARADESGETGTERGTA